MSGILASSTLPVYLVAVLFHDLQITGVLYHPKEGNVMATGNWAIRESFLTPLDRMVLTTVFLVALGH